MEILFTRVPAERVCQILEKMRQKTQALCPVAEEPVAQPVVRMIVRLPLREPVRYPDFAECRRFLHRPPRRGAQKPRRRNRRRNLGLGRVTAGHEFFNF